MQIGEYYYILTLRHSYTNGGNTTATIRDKIHLRVETPRSVVVSGILTESFNKMKEHLIPELAAPDIEPSVIFFSIEPE